MGNLLNTPSQGQSEVLETLHYEGAIAGGIQVFRLGAFVSNRYGGDENREGSDPVFEADIITVLAALQTAGYVVADDDAGHVVDLTAGTPLGTTRIILTGAGRVQARHPRPRTQWIDPN
jgi:hypothetical protein